MASPLNESYQISAFPESTEAIIKMSSLSQNSEHGLRYLDDLHDLIATEEKIFSGPVMRVASYEDPHNHKHELYSTNHHIYREIKPNQFTKNHSRREIQSLTQYNVQQILGSLTSNSQMNQPTRLSGINLGLLSMVELGALRPEDLPELALPVIEFIDSMKPHIVIGCDRGGRLFALAIHATWGKIHEEESFPSLDGKIHFARISKSEDPLVLQEKVDEIVEKSIEFGRHKGRSVEDGEELRVLFVDDWVIGGGTMELAKSLVEKYGAKAYFAVMCGGGADTTGNPKRQTNVSWHDRPEEIGVNYFSGIALDENGDIVQTQKVIAVRAEAAVNNRRRIQVAARKITTETVASAA